MAGRICVTGDTHGILDTYKILNFQDNENKLDYDDYLIICGDAGIVWNNETLNESIDYYEAFGTNILFVDGNHENFDLLNSFNAEVWNGGKVHKLSNHIYHLLRGEVFNILGKIFLAMGGAKSVDRAYRREHISWWEDEEITNQDLLNALGNLKEHNNKIDFIISHSQPISIMKELEELLTCCGERIPYFLAPKFEYSISNEILEEMLKKVKFKHWYSGHLHIDENLTNHTLIYNKIIQIL